MPRESTSCCPPLLCTTYHLPLTPAPSITAHERRLARGGPQEATGAISRSGDSVRPRASTSGSGSLPGRSLPGIPAHFTAGGILRPPPPPPPKKASSDTNDLSALSGTQMRQLVTSFALQGGATHAHIVIATSQGSLVPGRSPQLKLQWFRLIPPDVRGENFSSSMSVGNEARLRGGGGEGTEAADGGVGDDGLWMIHAVDGNAYQPNCDDIGARVCCRLTDSRETCMKLAEFGPVVADPALVSRVETPSEGSGCMGSGSVLGLS